MVLLELPPCPPGTYFDASCGIDGVPDGEGQKLSSLFDSHGALGWYGARSVPPAKWDLQYETLVRFRDPELVTAAYCCAPRFGVAAGVALAVPIAASSDFLYLGSLR